jgi:hypothetical protein
VQHRVYSLLLIRVCLQKKYFGKTIKKVLVDAGEKSKAKSLKES